jgi:hypothetical protein
VQKAYTCPFALQGLCQPLKDAKKATLKKKPR